jgi:hypothetical protein
MPRKAVLALAVVLSLGVGASYRPASADPRAIQRQAATNQGPDDADRRASRDARSLADQIRTLTEQYERITNRITTVQKEGTEAAARYGDAAAKPYQAFAENLEAQAIKIRSEINTPVRPMTTREHGKSPTNKIGIAAVLRKNSGNCP